LISQPAFSTLPTFILFFDFYFEKKSEFLGITQNWVMTGMILLPYECVVSVDMGDDIFLNIFYYNFCN
jgi:hypothetical protein